MVIFELFLFIIDVIISFIDEIIEDDFNNCVVDEGVVVDVFIVVFVVC